jgi:hypothetical protein
MKFSFRLLLLFVLIALVAVGAGAQNFNGQFTLTHEINWGKAVLPPGDYSYRLNRVTDMQPLMVTVRGTNGNEVTATIMPQSYADRPVNYAEYDQTIDNLIIFREGNVRTVRALQLGSMNLTIFYSVPASVEHLSIASAERVPLVTGSGK